MARRGAFPARVIDFLPFGHWGSPSGEVWDACAACSKGDRLWGCAPFSAPSALPPKHPAGRSSNYRSVARARGSSCGSFLPSLRSVWRSPSAPRKCPNRLARWVNSVSAYYHGQVHTEEDDLKDTLAGCACLTPHGRRGKNYESLLLENAIKSGSSSGLP